MTKWEFCPFGGGELSFEMGQNGVVSGVLSNAGSGLLHAGRFGFTVDTGCRSGRVIAGSAMMGESFRRYELEHLSAPISTRQFLLLRCGNEYLLAGLLSCRTFIGSLRLGADGILSIEYYGDGKAIAPGEGVAFEKFALLEGGDWQKLLEDYADLAAADGGRRFTPAEWNGWGSWDYYCGKVSAACVLENQEELRAYGLERPLVQIDDGYCLLGDWLEADEARFPGGIKALAAEIIARGGTPGVWMAPFVARRSSRLFTEHPEWFLRDQDGNPRDTDGSGSTYILDFSQEEVCSRWRKTLETIRDEWQINYFKLDFLNTGLMAAVPAVAMTAPERFGRCFAIIREVLPDAYVLGCTAYFTTCTGLVDGMRVGSDISPRADWMRSAYSSCIASYYQHRRLWNNDSDYAIVRLAADEDSEIAPYPTKRSIFRDRDLKTLANFLRTCGASLIAGDKLGILGAERRELLQRIFRHGVSRRWQPLDIWNGDSFDTPGIILSDAGNGICRLGFFNLHTEKRTFRLTGVEGSWQDIDSDQPYEARGGVLAFELEEGESVVLVGRGDFDALRYSLLPAKEESAICLPPMTGGDFTFEGAAEPIALGGAANAVLVDQSSRQRCMQQGAFAGVLGVKELLGVPLGIRDECIAAMRGAEIAVNKKCRKLYFLLNASQAVSGALADLTVVCANGEAVTTELQAGEVAGNMFLSYSLPWRLTTGRIAWHEPVSDAVLYMWECDLGGEKEVQSLRLGAAKQLGFIYIVAITAIV